METHDKLNVEAAKRLKHLSLSDLADTAQQYPGLQHCKAAKIRWFTPVAVQLAKEFNSHKAGKRREAVVKGLDKVYSLLAADWKKWNRPAFQAFHKTIEDFMAHYRWLASNALKEGLHLWSLVQKSHMLLHSAEQSQFLHPALAWTYGSESFMGWIVQIASSCTSGTGPVKLPLKVLPKFRLVFHLYLKNCMSIEED